MYRVEHLRRVEYYARTKTLTQWIPGIRGGVSYARTKPRMEPHGFSKKFHAQEGKLTKKNANCSHLSLSEM